MVFEMEAKNVKTVRVTPEKEVMQEY